MMVMVKNAVNVKMVLIENDGNSKNDGNVKKWW